MDKFLIPPVWLAGPFAERKKGGGGKERNIALIHFRANKQHF